MKIVIYTVADCKFSQSEKDYLKAKSLVYEEKDVEKDHAALEEMLKVGNNFAGTPVTQITTDDGKTTVLKGFTQEEFDQALNFAPAAPTSQPENAPTPPTIESPPAVEPLTSVVVETPTAVPPQTEPTPPNPTPAMPEPLPTPPTEPSNPPTPMTPPSEVQTVAPASEPNPLDSILADLQTKIGTDISTAQAPSPTTPAPAEVPSTQPPVEPPAQQPSTPPTPEAPSAPPVPAAVEPPATGTPTIPDFPAK